MMVSKLKTVEDLANKEVLTHKMQLVQKEQEYQTKLEEQQKATEQANVNLQTQIAELQEQLNNSRKDSESLLSKSGSTSKKLEEFNDQDSCSGKATIRDCSQVTISKNTLIHKQLH